MGKTYPLVFSMKIYINGTKHDPFPKVYVATNYIASERTGAETANTY